LFCRKKKKKEKGTKYIQLRSLQSFPSFFTPFSSRLTFKDALEFKTAKEQSAKFQIHSSINFSVGEKDDER
jgi:hypothetical protein